MLRDAFFLIQSDVRYLFRQRETWLWTFVMPVAFFYLIGSMTRGFSGSRDTQDPIAEIGRAHV